MPWYKSGTVSVVLNSNAVIGAGTAFIANSRVGDAFRGPDGGWYEVTNIASDTALSISPNYQGASNAAGTYALAPMQGYVKDSADALRALVNQYGVKMAALGTTGNYEVLPVSKGGTGGTDQAAGRTGLGLGTAATENVIPVTKGGTGGTDQAGARTGLGLGSVAVESTVPVTKGGTGGTSQSAARTGLGLGSAAVAPIVGTASQSGGIPTGAILERGSNANGEWTKYADGTMICRGLKDLGTQSFIAVGNVFYTGVFSGIPFPQVFTSLPETYVGIISSGGLAWASQGSAFPTTTATPGFFILNPAAASNSVTAMWTAIGRWYA
jgi:hypothetical protein